MKQDIVSVGVTICRQSMTKEALPEQDRQVISWRFGSEKADALVSVTEKDGCLFGTVQARLQGEPFRENDGVGGKEALRVSLG